MAAFDTNSRTRPLQSFQCLGKTWDKLGSNRNVHAGGGWKTHPLGSPAEMVAQKGFAGAVYGLPVWISGEPMPFVLKPNERDGQAVGLHGAHDLFSFAQFDARIIVPVSH